MANRIGWPVTVLYLGCMLFVPWLQGRDWAYVQGVWYSWQTFNAGMLALFASFIAFNISAYNEERQRERQFTAARVFLPHALSELSSYCESSWTLLREAFGNVSENDVYDKAHRLATPVPCIPQDIKEIFSRCIEVAEPEVGEYLANILVELQIHDSRINSLKASASGEDEISIYRSNIHSSMFDVGNIQALTDKLFPFARGTEPFTDIDLKQEDILAAQTKLNWLLSDIDGLVDFTKRHS